MIIFMMKLYLSNCYCDFYVNLLYDYLTVCTELTVNLSNEMLISRKGKKLDSQE